MPKRITLKEYEDNHSVTSSGVSTIDMYWLFVQYKLYNIILCKDISFDAVNDTIADANWGLKHIDIEYQYNKATPILDAYKQQFLFIIKQLEALDK